MGYAARSAVERGQGDLLIVRQLQAACALADSGWARLLADDATYELNSLGAFDGRADYVRLETTSLSPIEVADRVIAHFGLPRSPDNPVSR